jgi:hypothetical protein
MDNDPKRKWFIWGMVLAWAPSVPFIVGGVLHAFRGISGQKATGLGAVAGGLAEVYLTSGLALTFICLVGGIVLLGRSFSGGHRMRALFSVLSMCWSALMLFIFGLFAWLFFVQFPHAVRGPQ